MKKENASWDYLKVLKKDEIIEFLKREIFFRAPEKDRVDFFKWDITARKLQKEMDELLADTSHLKIAAQIDALGEQFNNENDTDKQLKILKKREVLF